MYQIFIDEDIFKLIKDNLKSFEETPNDVLKRLILGNRSTFYVKNSNEEDVKHDESMNKSGIFTKGVFIPSGTKLRKLLHGITHEAIVSDGYIIYNGEKYNSPSAAGNAASGTSVNGWIFWDFFDSKDSKWRTLNDIRNGHRF